MQVHIFSSEQAIGRAAAALIQAKVLEKPNCVLGLATGSTPIPTDQSLIELNQAGLIDFSGVTTYNLDEYVGLTPDHVCSYRRFMNEQLFDHVNIDKANTHVPPGNGADPVADAAEYEAAVQAAHVDLQLLGIGRNGHIGFNEPADVFGYATGIVTLTDSTIDANTRFFNSRDEVPKRAISMGIGTIMSAKSVLLIATVEAKADAIKAAVEGEIDPRVPASILRAHPNCIFLLDEAAASKLTK